MNFKRFHESRNLFDKSTVTHGYYVNDMTGIIATNPTYEQEANASDYIPISGDSVSIYSNPTGKWRWGAFYDSNKTYVSGITGYNKTITIPENARYMRLTVVDEILDTLMVNLGSTALPYEPYSSEVWHDTPHYVHNTSTDTITTLPVDIYPNAATATVGLKGNTVQSTTPTPQNPVMPQGTGERTAQLFDGEIATQDVGMGSNRYGFTIAKAGAYTIKITGDVENGDYCYARSYSNGEYSESFYLTTGFSKPTYTATISDGEKIVVFNASSSQTKAQSEAKFARWKIMANTGSTALPYEPWGIKIPISSASTTTPVYLGEVQTTRKVKKVVYDGKESWNLSKQGNNTRAYTPQIPECLSLSPALCTHFDYNVANVGYPRVGEFVINSSKAIIFGVDGNTFADVNAWKAYLTQQYAAGTPVTVWYVLAEPETAVVNEPLMKIGTYADEVSNVSIPVTAGGDTISVDTTVQPSEATVNYKGWHPVADVHERENGAWD